MILKSSSTVVAFTVLPLLIVIDALSLLILFVIKLVLNSKEPTGFSCTIAPWSPAAFTAPLIIVITFAIGFVAAGILISPVS